jgi:hypothetical protein
MQIAFESDLVGVLPLGVGLSLFRVLQGQSRTHSGQRGIAGKQRRIVTGSSNEGLQIGLSASARPR